jgi:hypothetical protein
VGTVRVEILYAFLYATASTICKRLEFNDKLRKNGLRNCVNRTCTSYGRTRFPLPVIEAPTGLKTKRYVTSNCASTGEPFSILGTNAQ